MRCATMPPACWATPEFEKQFAALERRARRESPGAEIERSADLRYRGQSYELNVPWSSAASRANAAFHSEHARVYGYSLPEREVEVVTIRVRARVTLAKPRIVRPTMRKGSRGVPPHLGFRLVASRSGLESRAARPDSAARARAGARLRLDHAGALRLAIPRGPSRKSADSALRNHAPYTLKVHT